jgi:hypothetical protein
MITIIKANIEMEKEENTKPEVLIEDRNLWII